MLGGLVRAVLLVVLIVAVVLVVGSFVFGYRVGHRRTAEPAAVGTSGHGIGHEATSGRGAEAGERAGTAAERPGNILSEGTVTAKIKAKMALDDTVKARDIHVSTSNGVVTLSGEVGSPSERRRAVQIARDTEGVKSVIDRLRVER